MKKVYVWCRAKLNYCYNLLPGRYSPDGLTEDCLLCPEGSQTPERGASSVDQCTGNVIILCTTVTQTQK